MNTSTLLIIAGVGAAVYFLWWKPKQEAEETATETAKKAAMQMASGASVALAGAPGIWPPQTADTIAV